MPTIKLKYLLPLAAATLLAACSGGGSSSSAPSGSEISVSGFATQGIVKFAQVEIKDANDADNVLASGKTDETGFYDFTIPASAGFSEGFLLVEVSNANDGATRMTCDAPPPTGCGDVPFGEEVTVTDEFGLQAIMEVSEDNNASLEVNLNPFTDLAAALVAESNVVDRGNLNSAAGLVRQLFELESTPLTNIPSVDITRPDEVARAVGKKGAIRAALLSGGLLASAYNRAALDQAGATAENRLQRFRERFAQQGQLLLNKAEDDDNDDTISLGEILDNSVTLISRISADSDIPLAVSAPLRADLAEVKRAPAGALTNVVSSPSSGATDAEQARAFVSDIDLLLTALDQQSVEADRIAFEDSLELSEDLISVEFELLIADLSLIASTFEAAFEAFKLDPSIITFTPDSADALPVSISTDDAGETTFSTVFSDADRDIDISAALLDVDDITGNRESPDTTGLEDGESATVNTNGSATLSILGTISRTNGTDTVSMNIKQGLAEISELDVSETFTVDTNDSFPLESGNGQFNRFNFELEVALVVESTQTLTFDGLIEFSFDEFRSDFDESTGEFDESVGGDIFFTESNSANVDFSNVVLAGTLTSLADDISRSVGFTLSVALDTRNLTFGTLPLGSTRVSTVDTSVNEQSATFIRVDGFTSILELISYEEFIQVTGLEDGFTGFDSSNGADFVRIANTEDSILTIAQGSNLQEAQNPNFRRLLSTSIAHESQRSLIPAPESVLQTLNISDFLNQALNFELTLYISVDGEGLYAGERDIVEPDGITESIYTLVCTGFCFNPTSQGFAESEDQLLGDTGLAKGSASISLSTNIIGIDVADPTVTFTVNFGQQSQDVGNFDISIDFAGRTFETTTISLDLSDSLSLDETNEVILTNQDGIALTLNRDESDIVTGSLVKDGVELATITEEDGALLVRFLDDESPNLVTLGF
ncbi:MAG: hypothetical protein KUG79_15310 [Pseudomonadales bacterium]|nr:hypothetical protein [Pseudomonadales bacterium]